MEEQVNNREYGTAELHEQQENEYFYVELIPIIIWRLENMRKHKDKILNAENKQAAKVLVRHTEVVQVVVGVLNLPQVAFRDCLSQFAASKLQDISSRQEDDGSVYPKIK